MVLAADQTVFSIPFRFLWTTGLNGSLEILDQPATGLSRFVGDDSNHLLRIFEERENSIFSGEDNEFWPLVLHGPSGTGKTSLAMALLAQLISSSQIQSEPKQSNSPAKLADSSTDLPAYRPTVFSAIDFDRRFRSAISSDSADDFRRRIVRSKGLFLDNLHQIGAKPAAQHELFQIIDKMLDHRYPVIITMDRHPLACDQMIPQLASRLSGGLSLPVQQPGRAAREVIIRDLAQVYGFELSPEVIVFLVQRLNVSVPQIVHFFGQLKTAYRSSQAFSDSASSIANIDIDFIHSMFQLSDDDRLKQAKLVIGKVAAELKLKPADIRGDSRKQSVVFARNVAIYLIRQLLEISFTKIGSLFGNRDHTTVMHSFRRIESIISNPDSGTDKNRILKLECQLTNLFAHEIKPHD